MTASYDCRYCGKHTPTEVGEYAFTVESKTTDGVARTILGWSCRPCVERLDLTVDNSWRESSAS